jgi:two-component system response regulator RegX3
MASEQPFKVLIVEDDSDLSAALARAFENAGFAAFVAGTGYNGLRQIKSQKPDIVILDLTLPDIDGVQICRKLQKKNHIPILMLTARTEEDNRVAGLEAGATDYVTKPFSVRELIARVKAILRRVYGEPPPQPTGILRVGPIELDPEGYTVKVGGDPVELTRTEFTILHTLMRNAGLVVTRDRLSEAIWGGRIEESHVLDVHISNLRRKIEADPRNPKHLITVRRIGYKIV